MLDGCLRPLSSKSVSKVWCSVWLTLTALHCAGVTAYNGAAPLITDTTLLGNAIGIGLVEAYHAGIVSFPTHQLLHAVVVVLPCCVSGTCDAT